MDSDQPMLFDALIPIGPNDFGTARIAASSVRKFVTGVRNLYIVSRENPGIEGTHFISEEIFPFDLLAVRSLLGVGERGGWYLQQLVKLYFPKVVTTCLDRVLAVDADTIFLRPCRFIEDNRVVLNFGNEFHPPYFDHMQRMHPDLRKLSIYSGITHCMLFDRTWLAELMKTVEVHHRGMDFWKVYLRSVDPKHRDASGASEYEAYFNFCLARHAADVLVKRFRWRNVATTDDVRPELYDYVSFHWHARRGALDYKKLSERVFSA